MTSLVVESIEWFQVLIYRKQQTLSKTHNTFSYIEFSKTKKNDKSTQYSFKKTLVPFLCKSV
jgi:hypothetical protein